MRPIDLLHGEWWRLISCCFLHAGALHLFVNLFSIYSLTLTESLWGSWRFLIIYLFSGLAGSCAALIVHPGSGYTPLQGASGAIWGLMASMLAWLFMNRAHLPAEDLSRWVRALGMVVAINIAVSFMPNVSAGGHFGGGLAGFILATLLHVQTYAKAPRRTIATILIVLLPFVCIGALREAMAKDPRWQQLAAQDQFLQRQALELQFRREVLPAVDEAGIAYAAVESTGYALADKKPKDRPLDPRYPAWRESLISTRALAEAALRKLGDQPVADPRTEEMRLAGREYMHAVVEQIDRFSQMADESIQWTQVSRTRFSDELRKAYNAWAALRG